MKPIKALTSLRAFAALMVFAYHYWLFHQKQIGANFILSEAYIGVDIFFVLSGFLLTLRYHDDVQSKVFPWRTYLVKRIARIWPVYLLVLAVIALLGVHIGIENITMMQGFNPNVLSTGIQVTWSLTVEECFYLLLPVILTTLMAKRLTIQIPILIAWSVGLILIGYGIYSDTMFMLSRTIFGYLFDFSVGIFIAQYCVQCGTCRRGLGYILIGSGLVGLIAIEGLIVRLSGGGLYNGRGLVFFVSIATGGIIYGLTADTLISRLLGVKPLEYLGRISYVFYLVHLTPMTAFIQNADPIIYYAVTNAMSAVIFQFFEYPMQRLIVQKLIEDKSINPHKDKEVSSSPSSTFRRNQVGRDK